MLLFEGKTPEEAETEVRSEYDGIELPRRGTPYSAGYDIRTPFALTLPAGASMTVPTGLRVKMAEDMWLGIYIRSSLGFKYNVRLKNSVAVIDADYYGADNEGRLKVGIYNGGDRELVLAAGDAFAQGILQKYYLTEDDDPVRKRRTGGFGSTNREA